MILYTITNKAGNVIGWAGSMADAGHKKKEIGGKAWQQCEVPTSKGDLLEFLNTHAVEKTAEEDED